MRRRTYLQFAGAGAALATAGCLGGDDNTVLGPQDSRVDSEALAYPAHGEELPEVTLPSPLHDREVATTEFVDERHLLMTFVFTRCHGPCPALTATLAQVQADAAENGYGEEVALLPVTFDPEHDTEEVLRAFSENRGADPSDENWQFLRPESHEHAQEVVNGTFGVGFERTEAYEPAGSHDGHEGSDGEASEEDNGEMQDMFVHLELVILANDRGYVERAYQGLPQVTTVLDDIETVRTGGGFL